MKRITCAVLAGLMAASFCGAAQPQEAAIRKNLSERLPRLGKIDEVTASPMAGLWEVRVGGEIYYSDAEGNFLLQGSLIDAKAQRNLTEERQEKLNAIDFSTLPLKDAFTIVRGNGKRKVALFEDPNCGYCKRFEADLQKVDNVTIHVFLYPILGPDSLEKSRNLWCTPDRPRAWLDWMLRNQAAPKATCDVTALQRNIEFGKAHRLTGTPTLVFANGQRVPGAIGARDVEKLLAEAK